MHIVYIHQYFKTPAEPGGTRSYWISRELINAGHRVTMITAKKEGQQKPVVKKDIDGISVFYVRNPYHQSYGFFRRLRSYFRFIWKAGRVLFKQKDVGLVIATSTPLTVGIPPLLMKKIRGVPYIFEVRDLWPEVPIQMGALRNPLLQKIARWLEKAIYNNAKHVVALSPGMQEGVVRLTGRPEKVSMIPNMAKVDKFGKGTSDDTLRQRLGLQENSFRVIHFGAMGVANGLDYILDAARILQHWGESDVEFVFLGEGSQALRLMERTQLGNIGNIRFFNRVPMEQLAEVLKLCDASIVSFLDIPILYTNSPNKLFDSLSAGLPVIVNSAGWTMEMVEKHHCGAYVNPSNPEELANLIVEWKNDRALLKKLGQNARQLAESSYDKSILCAKFVTIVNTLNKKQCD